MPDRLERIDCPPKHLDDYVSIVPNIIDQIRAAAKPLRGLKITHLNATSLGGGVAEILRSLVPLQKDIGLVPSWYTIPPKEEFFEVTKKIHNLMQGKEGNLTAKEKKIYLDHNRLIAQLLEKIETDVLAIHDPQPAAALHYIKVRNHKLAVWRSHIDTSHPNKKVWNFLTPFLDPFDHFVFTLPEYTNRRFPPKGKVSFITPVIDPLSPKNLLIDKTEARIYLERFGIDIGRPLVSQISRYDPWKDPEGVVDAYRLAKKKFPKLQLALVAQMTTDDPEGVRLYEQLKRYVEGEDGIFLLVNLPKNDEAVNAFQTGSDIILQKSIREGFGLTVTEAMWKKMPVIGGNVGGIKLQIKDGVNGFLVDSAEEAAEKIVYLLDNPGVREKVGRAAHESVKKKYLTPHKILNYLKLFRKLLGKRKTRAESRPRVAFT